MFLSGFLVVGALSGLGKAAVGGGAHLLAELEEAALHGVATIPVREEREGAFIHGTIGGHTGEINLGGELDLGGRVGVVFTAVDITAKNAVLEGGVWGTNDGAVPPAKHHIVAVTESDGDIGAALALLTDL